MALTTLHLRNRLLAVNCYVLVGTAAEMYPWCTKRFAATLDHPPTGAGLAFVDTPIDTRHGYWACVIWIERFRKGNAFDAGRLAHEALHIAWRLLDALGSADEETHCYLVQWLVEETTWRLTRTRKH